MPVIPTTGCVGHKGYVELHPQYDCVYIKLDKPDDFPHNILTPAEARQLAHELLAMVEGK